MGLQAEAATQVEAALEALVDFTDLEMLRRSHPSVEQTRATLLDVEAEGAGWGDDEERTPAIRMKLHLTPVLRFVPRH